MAQVERKKQGDQIVYLLTNGNNETLALTPRELMQLLTWMQDHENELVNDALQNSVDDEMEGDGQPWSPDFTTWAEGE